jgi:hypothetical protein
MDVREETAGLNYEAEYNRLREELAKANQENQYLREELKSKESELRYYLGFENAVNIIFGGYN